MQQYRPFFAQTSQDIDAYDLHSDWWQEYKQDNKDKYNKDSLFFYGPPGTGKYAHAIHFLRDMSPSHFAKKQSPPLHIDLEVPSLSHYSNLPAQSFLFHTSDAHIEIHMDQLGPDPLTVWNHFFQHAAQFEYIVCLQMDKAPECLLDRMYTFLIPGLMGSNANNANAVNAVNKYKWPRFIFVGEHIWAMPLSIMNAVKVVQFGRPDMDRYKACVRSLLSDELNKTETEDPLSFMDSMTARDIVSIPELVALGKSSAHGVPVSCADAPDPFGHLCEKMVSCIQSIRSAETADSFSIRDVRDILTEWAVHRISFEEGIWYIVGRFINESLITFPKWRRICDSWKTAKMSDEAAMGEPNVSKHEFYQAEYMLAELIRQCLF